MTTQTKTTPITHAVIQSGYCVFGTGSSEDEAITDAANWIEDANDADDVRKILAERYNHVDGDMIVIDSSHDEFGSYLKNQGGFVQIDGQWFAE